MHARTLSVKDDKGESFAFEVRVAVDAATVMCIRRRCMPAPNITITLAWAH